MSQANAPTVRPDFFLIGAAKSGTTSLANYLDSHPDVYLCKPKEPNFFAFPPNVEPSCQGPAPAEVLFDKLLRYSVTVPAEYDRLFKPATTGQQTGDASVRYLYEPSAAERIANHAPNAKAIAILREPVARMYSHYHMNVRNGFEPLTFEDALQAEDERVTSGWGWDWHYRRVGRYAKQLDRYFAALGRENVLVLFHADLQANADALWDTACRFLGINRDYKPDFGKRSLVGATPRSRWLRDLVWQDNPLKRIARSLLPRGVRQAVSARVNQANVGGIPFLDPSIAARLRKEFRDDNARLADLLRGEVPW